MRPPDRPRRAVRTPVVLGLFGVVLALVAVAAAAPPAASPLPGSGTPGPGTVEVTGTLTYNGRATANATSPGSALPVAFAGPATVEFSWQAAGGKINQPLSIAIQTARLQVVFLGLGVWTKDQTLAPPSLSPRGSVNMSADFSLDRYLLEGLYQFTGSLISPNGSTVWSESFYVKATAPYHLTGVNLGLVGVGAYELFSIATVGRWVSRQDVEAVRTRDAGDLTGASDSGSGRRN